MLLMFFGNDSPFRCKYIKIIDFICINVYDYDMMFKK